VNLFGIYLFQLVKTAATATITQRFPFSLGHRRHRFLNPEIGHLKLHSDYYDKKKNPFFQISSNLN
jgi:hypothetical protein